MIGEITSSTPVSLYQPSKDVAEVTARAKKDVEKGYDILNHLWVELGGLSVIDRMNRDQRTFNAFVDEEIEDPAEAWKWKGTRSKARNKAISTHAQLTSGYIVPNYIAQNDDDEEDIAFSDIMRDIAEWQIENSNYKSSFLLATMGMLVNPVTYIGAEYCEVIQEIRVKKGDGYETREILDEVLSGFQAPVYSADQILITNAFVQNIQRQRAIAKVQWIDYEEAEAKWGDHENFMYVNAGVNVTFSEETGLFYDVTDDDHSGMVQVITYEVRSEDEGIDFVGGVYMGNVENVEWNPIKHRDGRNAPKYNVVPFGYQRINEHFYFYKSLMNAQYWDNRLLDAQYEIGMNRLFLDTNMPVAISGSDQVDSDIIFPSAVVSFADKDTRITPLLPAANLGNLFTGMSVVEQSMDEGSVSDVTGGQLPDANQKATSINVAEKNAKILLRGVGKTMAESVVQIGQLMADIAVNHLTVPQIDQLTGKSSKLKYRSFVLKDKAVNGKQVSKTIKLDQSLLGLEMSDEDVKKENIKMAMETGYPEHKNVVIRVNPEIAAKMKYLCRVVPELMFSKNQEYMQAMMLQLTNQFAANPFVSLEALTRETMYQFFHGRAEDFMQKQAPALPQPPGAPQPPSGNMAMNKALAGVLPTGVNQ